MKSQYTNPVIPGFRSDPSICRAGDDFFLVNTSFEFFPGLPIFHSRDLVNWRQIGHVLDRPSQLDMADVRIPSGGIYGSTIRHHQGRFYVVTSVLTTGPARHCLVSTEDPFGDWSEPVWIDASGDPGRLLEQAIDPSLFIDDEGRFYLTISLHAKPVVYLIQSEIDPRTGALLAPPRELWRGTGMLGTEGPHTYKIHGWYYLMAAEGGTEYGHTEVLARGDSPWGPWEPCPHNPILTNRSTGLPIQGVGHADLVDAPDGSWWIVFHGFRPLGYHGAHTLGRETCLASVHWNKDGWPEVANGGRIKPVMEAEFFTTPTPWPPEPVRDEFDTLKLRDCWNFIRNPIEGTWSLTERPGWLTLRGNANDLDSCHSPVWVGRRQCAHVSMIETLLEFSPRLDGEEAGLSVYQNYTHHYEIALRRTDGRNQVIVRRRIGSLQKIEHTLDWKEERVRLRIAADKKNYAFACAPAQGDWSDLGQGECRYLSTEVGGLFTGVYFALYATGPGSGSTTPAHFDYVDYLEPEKLS